MVEFIVQCVQRIWILRIGWWFTWYASRRDRIYNRFQQISSLESIFHSISISFIKSQRFSHVSAIRNGYLFHRYYYLSNVLIASKSRLNQHINNIYLVSRRVSFATRFVTLVIVLPNKWMKINFSCIIEWSKESGNNATQRKKWSSNIVDGCEQWNTHFHDEIVEFSFSFLTSRDACWIVLLRKSHIAYTVACVCIFQALLYYFIYG